MSTALVLAAPEHKRILRELLDLPEPWSVANRNLYRQMLTLELAHATCEFEDVLAETVEKQRFSELVLQGVPLSGALEQANAAANARVRSFKREQSPGRLERKRRRTFREAVTDGDGARAVTTGLVETCIVCNGPFRSSSPRGYSCRPDSAYCSNACRQAAYRKRLKANTGQRPEVRETQDMMRAAREAGLSQSDINEFIRIADLTPEEFEELVAREPQSPTTMLRSMRAAKRREAVKGATNQPDESLVR